MAEIISERLCTVGETVTFSAIIRQSNQTRFNAVYLWRCLPFLIVPLDFRYPVAERYIYKVYAATLFLQLVGLYSSFHVTCFILVRIAAGKVTLSGVNGMASLLIRRQPSRLSSSKKRY